MKKDKKIIAILFTLLLAAILGLVLVFSTNKVVDLTDRVEYVYAEQTEYYFESEKVYVEEYWTRDVESVIKYNELFGHSRIEVVMEDGEVFIYGQDNVIIQWKVEE